jgi:DNA-binding HxlR family transcriptional regulator
MLMTVASKNDVYCLQPADARALCQYMVQMVLCLQRPFGNRRVVYLLILNWFTIFDLNNDKSPHMNVANLIVINPVALSLDLLGDRWTILIMRDTFLGRHRFEEFRRNTGASRSTLSNRLGSLVDKGILYRQAYQQAPLRNEYRLTEKGLALYPWALLIWQWESEWGGADDSLPQYLEHKTAEPHQLQPVAVCRHCQAPFSWQDVVRDIVQGEALADSVSATTMGKQRRSRSVQGSEQDASLSHIVDIIGDRWTVLILAAAFVGLLRYDDLRKQLGIATNILSSRLKMLTEADIFERQQYQNNPPRYEYSLKEKGLALYPFTMVMRQWARDWIDPMPNAPFRLVHKNCGKELDVDVICQGCSCVPSPAEVSYRTPAD